MAQLKYLCTRSCFVGGVFYQAGKVYLLGANPNALFFSTTDIDVIEPAAGFSRDTVDGTMFYGGIGWDDMRFPATRTKRGALDKPDFDYDELALMFPQNDAAEIAYYGDQFPHSMFLGANAYIVPHLHIKRTVESTPVFKMKYRIIEFGKAIPAFSAPVTSSGWVQSWGGSAKEDLLAWPAISVAGIELSSVWQCQVYREDNVVTGDVAVYSFDIHIPLDSFGSGREIAK